jgi:inner membrane protein
MDTGTHILLGAVTAQLGFRQRIGRDATWAAVAAAVVTDLDLATAPMLSVSEPWTTPLGHMMMHRGLTHSLLIIPVTALVVAGAWWALRRKFAGRPNPAAASQAAPPAPVPFWLLYLCALVAAVSHPLLDWSTAYGTELFAPLTDARYALGIIAAVDIFFTPVLALTLLACFLIRKVGLGPKHRATLVVGWVGFLLALGYLTTSAVLRQEAMAEARQLAGPARIVRVGAYPAIGSIFRWRGVVETENAWLTYRLSPLAGIDAARGPETAPREAGPWIDRARQLPGVQTYEWFAMGMVRATSRDADSRHIVEFHDMRFSPEIGSISGLWPLHVVFNDNGRVEEIEVRSAFTGRSHWRYFSQVWHDILEP